MTRQLFASIAAAALCATCASPSTNSTEPAKPAATNGVPRTADGKPDLQGIWQVRNRAAYGLEHHAAKYLLPAGPSVVEGGEIPYLPAAREQQRWQADVQRVHAWRLPRWPLWLLTVLVLGAAIYLGLVLGGYVPVPPMLEGLAEFWWSRP